MSLFDFAYEFPNSIEEIDRFTGKEFEVFLFEFFKVLDNHPRMTDDTNDRGIDLTIKLPHADGVRTVGIQAKRWKGKVGSNEIRTMLDGKDHYNLDEVWIITTSDLTSSAITTAKNNDIQILNRNDVSKLFEELKKHDVKYKNTKPVKKAKKSTDTKSGNYPRKMVEGLKKFRFEMSKKYKLYPVYNVFNNKMMYQIIDEMPKTLDELFNIKGLGPKRINTFGKELIDYINENTEQPKKNDADTSLYEMLISERPKIAKYNNLKEEDVYTDKVAEYLVRMKPRDKATLEKVFGFKKENIDIFGDYLVKKIYSHLNK